MTGLPLLTQRVPAPKIFPKFLGELGRNHALEEIDRICQISLLPSFISMDNVILLNDMIITQFLNPYAYNLINNRPAIGYFRIW